MRKNWKTRGALVFVKTFSKFVLDPWRVQKNLWYASFYPTRPLHRLVVNSGLLTKYDTPTWAGSGEKEGIDFFGRTAIYGCKEKEAQKESEKRQWKREKLKLLRISGKGSCKIISSFQFRSYFGWLIHEWTVRFTARASTVPPMTVGTLPITKVCHVP